MKKRGSSLTNGSPCFIINVMRGMVVFMTNCSVSAPAGRFNGLQTENARIFRGIPYGKAERFKRAEPVVFPDGYNAFSFGAKSIQNPESMAGPVEGPFAEDCLFLNIVCPSENRTGALLPVVFDIHGGAFQTGSGNDSGLFPLVTEEGEQLIAVSINYRLGALGYLKLDELLGSEYGDGNLGMYDQLLALRWVKENIASFGGDPERITIHGVSAGGKSVGAMMLEPAARPLFSQAILSSGGIMAVRTPSTARAITKKYLEILGLCDIKEILSCPVEKILSAQLTFAKSAGSTCLFGPVADGKLIPENWKEEIRSEKGWLGNTLIGNNLHELVFYQMDPGILEKAPSIAAELFGDRAEIAVSAYESLTSGVKTDEEKKAAWVKVFSDYMYRSHGDHLAQILAARGGKVWCYSFDFPPAHHAQDAMTIHMGAEGGIPNPNETDEDKAAKTRIQKAMRESFIRFITEGAPSSSLLPEWKAVTPGHNERMHLDRTFTFDDPASPSLSGFPDDVIHL